MEAAKKPSILEELKNGVFHFEIVSSPLTSFPTCYRRSSSVLPSSLFFARIRTQLEVTSPALTKVESFKVHKITGDGRCMFRALVKGMAMNKSLILSPRQERDNAGKVLYLYDDVKGLLEGPTTKIVSVKGLLEGPTTKLERGLSFRPFICKCLPRYKSYNKTNELRMAIKEVLCDNDKERHQYEEALIAITVDEPLKRYCQRIARPDFWGGESELLVLSKLCRQPIVVYIPEHEHSRAGNGYGFIPIAEYGADLYKGSRKEKAKKAVRLLYSGRNHYDLLV